MGITVIPAIKPYPGINSGGFEVITADGELNLVVNAYYDSATGNWYRVDESKPAWRMVMAATGNVHIYWVTSGTGAITWEQKFLLDTSAILWTTIITYIHTYSTAEEPDIPTESVALWEDTANNRYWLIWDKDGVQRKVELT